MSKPQWEKPPEERKDGFECLAFHRGKWTHVRWSKDHRGWNLGYGGAFIRDGGRDFAPLPENTPDRTIPGNGFYDWKG